MGIRTTTIFRVGFSTLEKVPENRIADLKADLQVRMQQNVQNAGYAFDPSITYFAPELYSDEILAATYEVEINE